MSYAYPSSARSISCSWQCHKNRNPPSTEPGTDYAAAYGSQLYAPGTGKIVDVKTTNSTATGRFITIDLDDGRRTRSLHLSTTGSAKVGQRVSKGQAISGAKTGGSGFGDDWGYGPHVHQTLWSSHSYSFCSTCTIDFDKYASAELGGNQREVLPTAAVNGRENPNTSGGVTQVLPAGTVGDFNGWVKGESVEGNNVWFRGEYSGDWFWSGGFTDKGTHNLADLNEPDLSGSQRQADLTDGANGRTEPKTSAPVEHVLAPGAVGNFDGWITGETVEGNSTWFRGKASQLFYWSGGFTDSGTHDLPDLNEPDPDTGTKRTVLDSEPCNVRGLPFLTSPVVSSEDTGTVIDMQGWTHGDEVDGNDVWFQRKVDGKWMWSGGFTDDSTTDLTEKPTPDPPDPADVDNPRGLAVETGYQWPFAAQWLDAPLGHVDCDLDNGYMLRTTAGSDQHPVEPVIDTYIVHYTATMVDQMDWFSYCNSRMVSPFTYMRRDGWQSQMIRPHAKPAATGADWNWRSLAVETLADNDNPFTDEQWEAHAENIAYLASFDGKSLDGVPVSFKIDGDHVIGHREADGQSTDCPGDAQMAKMDDLVARAQEIYDEKYGPEPDPDCPDCPDFDYTEMARAVNDDAARRLAE